MPETLRRIVLFAAGAVFAAIGAAAFWHWYPGPWHTPTDAALQAALERREELQARYAQAAPAAEQPAAAVAVPAFSTASACGFDPVLPARAPGDGQYSLQRAAALARGGQPDAYLGVARQAAQQGRVRDAEVAFIVACRLAVSQPARRADIESALAAHYAQRAATAGSAEDRTLLLERARLLLASSVEHYAATLGAEAAPTRNARRQLAAISQSGDAAWQRWREVEDDAAEPPRRDAGSPPDATAAPRRPAVQLVRSDPELAQLESDLARLRAQAASVTQDPAGFRRRAQQALAERDARCSDKACLLRWYARRRGELLEEF